MSEERRHDYPDIIERLGSLEVQIALLGTKFDSSHKAFREYQEDTHELNKKIVNTLYGNGQAGLTTRVSNLDTVKAELQSHSLADRWLFGIIITIQLALLGGIFFK